MTWGGVLQRARCKFLGSTTGEKMTPSTLSSGSSTDPASPPPPHQSCPTDARIEGGASAPQRFDRALTPLAVEGEGRPVEGRLPLFPAQHLDLGSAQGGGRGSFSASRPRYVFSINSAVALSCTLHRLTNIRGAPAYIKPRVSPISPSPLISLPRPVSHGTAYRGLAALIADSTSRS